MSTPIRPVEKRKRFTTVGRHFYNQAVDDHERTNLGSSLKAMFPQIPAVSKKNRKHRLPEISGVLCTSISVGVPNVYSFSVHPGYIRRTERISLDIGVKPTTSSIPMCIVLVHLLLIRTTCYMFLITDFISVLINVHFSAAFLRMLVDV
jgi:hypothetical protein